MPSDDCIGHFWGNKEEWESVATELLLQAYMKQSSLQDELDAITPQLLRSHPIYIHKSSTAEKLCRLVRRLFPNSQYRYME